MYTHVHAHAHTCSHMYTHTHTDTGLGQALGPRLEGDKDLLKAGAAAMMTEMPEDIVGAALACTNSRGGWGRKERGQGAVGKGYKHPSRGRARREAADTAGPARTPP